MTRELRYGMTPDSDEPRPVSPPPRPTRMTEDVADALRTFRLTLPASMDRAQPDLQTHSPGGGE